MSQQVSPPLTRFSTRTIFFFILLIAVILGWVNSVRRARYERLMLANRVEYAERELERKQDELRSLQRGKIPDRQRSFWEADLEGTNLAGITIARDSNAFQKASFCRCDLSNATLRGGETSFQSSRFDEAKLRGATLTGGGAAFQRATFAKSDLSKAVLKGGSASFQGASFEDAVMVGATLCGNFQGANISGARLEGADLTALESQNLASCYFKEPPTYDSNTQFPFGFNPETQQWRRVAAKGNGGIHQ